MPNNVLSRLWRGQERRTPTLEDAPNLSATSQKHTTPPLPTSTVPHPWPRLSESLTGPRQPGICQSCGATDAQLAPVSDPADKTTHTGEHDVLFAQLMRAMEARGIRV